jgi:hypothetical protein
MASQRFSYVKYDQEAMTKQQELRLAFEHVELLVDGLFPGRAKSLVYTSLEEAYMWVGKSIRDDQIARQGKIDEQPERNNE